MKTHELKTWPVYFDALWEGRKRFEARRDDRGFSVGDTLWLREYDPESGDYSGDELWFEVTYILRGGGFGVQEGYCVMSLTSRPAKRRATR